MQTLRETAGFPAPHLEVRLLEDAGQFGRAVVLHLETVDVPQDIGHQLHIVVLHRLQLHLLRLFVSLGADGGAQGWHPCFCSFVTAFINIYIYTHDIFYFLC